MSIKQRARELRRSRTEAERGFWSHVRGRRLSGFKLRRQHPIGPFIVDFVCLDFVVCLDFGLIMELDGGQGSTLKTGSKETKSDRSSWRAQGYRILRLWNNEVFEKMEGVLQTVPTVLNEASPSPRPSPPKSGERGKDRSP